MDKRCPWTSDNPQMIAYHDTEWGCPGPQRPAALWKLVLDGFQAGLSWAIILRKRDAFLKAFDGFNPDKMARYDARRIAKILKDPGIVRNKQKVKSAIGNARAFLKMKDAGEVFDEFLWQFVAGNQKSMPWEKRCAAAGRDQRVNRDEQGARRAGISLRGPTIVYAFMQAVGMVNDHLVTCFRYRQRLLSALQVLPGSRIHPHLFTW